MSRHASPFMEAVPSFRSVDESFHGRLESDLESQGEVEQEVDDIVSELSSVEEICAGAPPPVFDPSNCANKRPRLGGTNHCTQLVPQGSIHYSRQFIKDARLESAVSVGFWPAEEEVPDLGMADIGKGWSFEGPPIEFQEECQEGALATVADWTSRRRWEDAVERMKRLREEGKLWPGGLALIKSRRGGGAVEGSSEDGEEFGEGRKGRKCLLKNCKRLLTKLCPGGGYEKKWHKVKKK